MIRNLDGKNKASRLSFSGLLAKPFSKLKKLKKNSCDLTFDAVPDFPQPTTVNLNNGPNDNTINSSNSITEPEKSNGIINDFTQTNENRNSSYTNDNCNEEKSNSLPRNKEGKHTNSDDTNFKFGGSSIVNNTSVIVNGGCGIHIGNVFNNVNNVHYDGTPFNGEHIPKKVEKTEAIKELRRCVNKVTTGHLQLLSSHFGEKWLDIGVCLGFTTGELQCVSSETKDLQEKGFHVLMLWTQRLGNRATVGSLCKLLWQSKIYAAREAVRELSLKKKLFE